MTAPSLTELYTQLQSEFGVLQTHLTECMMNGNVLNKSGQHEEAVATFCGGMSDTDDFLRRWEECFRARPDGATHVDKISSMLLDSRATLLDMLGMAQHSAAKYAEAKATFNRGLALFKEQPNACRASLFASLANVCTVSEDFAGAEVAFQSSISEYDRVIASLTPLSQAGEMVRQYRICQIRTISTFADCALQQGERDLCRRRLAGALGMAEQHQLVELQQELWLKLAGHDLQNDPTDEALQRLTAERTRLKALAHDATFEIDADFLLADYWLARGVNDKARDLLNEALAAAEAAHRQTWRIHANLASLCEKEGDTASALIHHEAAFDDASRWQIPEAIGSVLQNLIPAQFATGDPAQIASAEARLGELRRSGPKYVLAQVLNQRALLRAKAQDLDGAWSDLDECEGLANSIDMKVNALFGKIAIRRNQGRFDDALKTIEAALAAMPTGNAFLSSQMMLRTFGTLHETAAFICAQLGRGRDAFRWADAGRAVRLQRNLSVMPDDFDSAHAFLSEQGAAAAVLCVGARQTLILGVTPHETEPTVEFVELGEKEVRRLLPADCVSTDWTQRVFDALPALSERLAPSLSRVARGCRILYVVPDSRLFFLPFAALTNPDGSQMLDHTALALVPSIGVLKHSHVRASSIAGSTCLALGFGSSGQFNFADQARVVASLDWPAQCSLLENDATPARWLEQARNFSVLHLSVHGQVSDGGQLSASQLELAGGRLSAADIAALNGTLPAQLVVLNACVSGRFNAQLAGDVGGFWEGFLRAGAASLVAALVYVHPADASDLALAFYRNWISGRLSKAEALRQAQLEMRSRNSDPQHWATHILIGDGCKTFESSEIIQETQTKKYRREQSASSLDRNTRRNRRGKQNEAVFVVTINETIKHLEAQRASAEKQVAALTTAISALTSLGTSAAPVAAAPAPAPAAKPAKKGGMSAAGRARLIAAVKARWAAKKAAAAKPAAKAPAKPKAVKPAKKKPVISAAGIEKIRAAQKARWAAVKAAKAAAIPAA